MPLPPKADSITHHCPECRQPVSCGHELGCETCWCEGFPKIPYAHREGDRCLCPACLRLKCDGHPQQSED